MRRLLAFAVTAFLCVPLFAQTKIRIGVFDSRLVALAYYNTDEHRAYVGSLMAELRNAKSVHDDKKVQELEYKGPALQNVAHYQVFSTGSIPNILEKLKPRLPAIAREANVVMIVSKWEVAHAAENVEYVDVTDRLVAEFKPSEKVQKWIADAKGKEPLPLLTAMTTKSDH